MKKIIALLLALTLCMGLFAACTGNEEPNTSAPAGNGLADAKEYLYAMYKADDGSVTRRDFTRVGVVMIDGVSYTVEWSSDSADVVIEAGDKGIVNININEEPAEDVTYTLTATVKDAEGKTESVSFTHTILAPKASGVVFVKTPEVETAYKFALVQNNLGQTLYLTGEMSGYYLATTENPFEAVDVFVEEVEGGMRLFFMKEEVKTYIDVVPRGADQPGKVNAVFSTEPSAVYTWDAERKTFVTSVEGNNWYIGTYSEYNTMSPSNTSYIEDVSKIGDSQFPAGLCTVNITATQVATPAVGTAYKFALVQNNLGQTLYFTGEMSGYYLATSVNPAEGINVFVEEVEGGVRIYFMTGETKTYIDVVPRGADQPGKVNVVLTTEPTCVFNWDAERKTYTTTVEENNWYLGTYNTYNTMSASNTSYIEDVSKIGESQFPAGMYTVEGFMDKQPDLGGEVEPEEPEEPEKPAAQLPSVTAPAADTAYKFGCIQVTTGNTVYIAGGIDQDRYLITTTDKAAALDVYVETVDGGYKFSTTIDGNKVYIALFMNDAGKTALGYTAEGTVFNFNAELNCWFTNLDGTDYYIGTYNTFETLSASKTSYINAENSGVSQFPAGFFN